MLIVYECTLSIIFRARYAPSLLRNLRDVYEAFLCGFPRVWAISTQIRSQNTPGFQIPGFVRNIIERVHSYLYDNIQERCVAWPWQRVFRHAERSGARRVVLLGEKEWEAGAYTRSCFRST